MPVNPKWFLQSTRNCNSSLRPVSRGTSLADKEQVKKTMDEMTRNMERAMAEINQKFSMDVFSIRK